MAKSIHTASKGGLRKNNQAGIKIIQAAYLSDYKILVLFNNNRMKVVDFTNAITKYAKGDYAVFATKTAFKKFAIENGTIVWGKNWDLIFPVANIFNGTL